MLLACLLVPAKGTVAQVMINEFMASNTATIRDNDFMQYSDWVELYNLSDSVVDIGGYFLTDQLGMLKWAVPAGTTVPAEGYILFWMDGMSTGLHAGFSLKQIGEEVGLYSPSGVLLDSVIYEYHTTDISYGRQPDGGSEWAFFKDPTPGASNTTPGSLGRAPKVQLLPDAGFYEARQTVELSVDNDNAEIYYTKDGSEPTKNSTLYTGTFNIYINTVVRARAYVPEYDDGVVATATYFIGEREFDLPVVSLSTDPDNLWDDEIGIYVVGTNGIEKFNVVANYNQDWERPVSMELFETDGRRAFQFDGGTKIYGQYSRKRPQKSLAIFARKQYGTREIPYRFFKEKPIDNYKGIVLRNSGNDWVETMFSDAFVNMVIKDMMDIDYMAYQPAAAFINGEYWGVLNIREKINEHYVEANYGIPSDQVDMLENAGDNSAWLVHGTYDDWVDLRTYCETNDLGLSQHYDYVKSKIDQEAFINYQVAEIYVHNTDWLTNNMKFWRDHNDPSSKWRYITYDIDRGFGIRGAPPDDIKKDGMSNLGRATYDDKYHRWVWPLVNFLENEEFEQLFLEKFQAHIYTTFHPDRIAAMHSEFISILENEMEYHIDLWGNDRDDWGPFDEQSFLGWYDIVDNKTAWAEDRPDIMMGYLKEHFGLGEIYKLYITRPDPEAGAVLVNGVEIPLDNFSGKFFDDFPVQLEAVPADGYKFVEWEGITYGKNDPTYSLSLKSDMELTAVFAKHDLRINEFMAANDNAIADEKGEFDDWIEIYNSGA